MLQIDNISLPVGSEEEQLRRRAAKLLGHTVLPNV